MNNRIFMIASFLLTALAFVPLSDGIRQSKATTNQSTQIEGLQESVRLVRDSNHIAHIFAQNDHDAFLMLGYVQAQDRFFQMDFQRRFASGTLAELVGDAALGQDIFLRTFGLRRAAEASVEIYPPETLTLFQAYADGVNAYMAEMRANPDLAPPEYAGLELTAASIPQWTVVDSVAIGKLLAFGLSFDLIDIDLTVNLAAYQQAGEVGGFDGTTLFFDDLFRTAPFDPTIAIPGFLSQSAKAAAAKRRKMLIEAARRLPRVIRPETLSLAKDYLDKLKKIPLLASALDRGAAGRGSNWWIVSGSRTESGYPMIANDPHLALDTAATFYEAHMVVENDPQRGPMNVNGVSFAGTPSVVLGCNERICWGATVNPMDVTDVYQEEIDIRAIPLRVRTVFDGEKEQTEIIVQRFRSNRLGDGLMDNVGSADVGLFDGGLTIIVPRRNHGPVVDLDTEAGTAITVQYTGWRGTRELETFRNLARAQNLDDFRAALQYFDFGSQNFSYADVDGNIAYFTSAELPLREDLQSGTIDGTPPFLIRDGTHHFRNEWLPVDENTQQPRQALEFSILPFDEMPHVVNPAEGFIVSANNDPAGTTLDNNPLNQLRPDGGLYYLNVGYATGFRAGRIRRLIENVLANGGRMTVTDMMRIQASNQLLDAEIMTPHIVAAFQNAQVDGASAVLAALANDARVAEAAQRLSNWDFSTPTGIAEGYDPGDDPNNLPQPSSAEIQNSVAATIYSLWRGQMIANSIDASLTRIGLSEFRPPSDQSMTALRNLLDNFDLNQGRGESGINFFEVEGASTPDEARDILILRSLQDALNLLASDRFAAAFGNSTNQRDYRWGRLHRIVFDHALGDPFSIPNAGGFSDLTPELHGVARSGGFGAVDASSHSARASSVNAFMFGSGPSRRFVGHMTPGGVIGLQVIPGGQSGDIRSPFYANMLNRWLTNQYHPMLITRDQVQGDVSSEQLFEPVP